MTRLRWLFTTNYCHHNYHETRYARENGKCNNCRILDYQHHWHITASQFQIQHARQDVRQQWTANSAWNIIIFTIPSLHLVSEYGLMFHSTTHNRSLWRWVFPGNWLHWYWQPKNNETKHYIHTKHRTNRKKTAHINKTNQALVWYAFYDLQPGNAAGLIFTTMEPARGNCTSSCSVV